MSTENEAQKIEKVAHKNIYEALSALQGELKPIERSAKVSFKMKNRDDKVEFNYAPLEKTAEAVYPLLAKHGLSYRHHLNAEGIECILTHETYKRENTENSTKKVVFPSGQLEEYSNPNFHEDNIIRSGRLPIDFKNPEMKEVGAQITYGRRYTLGLVLGIVTEEDKDAEMLEAKGQENLKKFAFQKVKEAIEGASEETIEAQIALLQKDLDLAKAVKEGTGKKAPSLGLSIPEYEVLLKMASERKAGFENQDAPADESGKK